MAYRSRAKMGVEVLRFQGDLNASEMIRVKNLLTRLLNKNQKKLLLDLKETRHVELAGLGILVDRLMKIRAQKGNAPDAAKDEATETSDEKKILDEQERKDAANGNANIDDNDEEN